MLESFWLTINNAPGVCYFLVFFIKKEDRVYDAPFSFKLWYFLAYNSTEIKKIGEDLIREFNRKGR